MEEFLTHFVDLALIHNSPQCKWNSEMQTVLMALEQSIDANVCDLEEQD